MRSMTNHPLQFHPPVIGHRGASGYAPENTLVAFTKAAQLGCQWIEFDVMLSADNQPMVFHDDTLDRTTNGQGDVGQYSYAELLSLDAGQWFNPVFSSERIPSLSKVATFLQQTKMFANVEIKPLSGQDEVTVTEALAVLSQYFPLNSPALLFSSFSFDALRHLRHAAPHAQIGILLHEWEPNWESVCTTLDCVSVHVNEEIMTPDAAKKIKSMGKKILCYTVNNPVRALELYSWGVDAVFSDVPDKIIQVI